MAQFRLDGVALVVGVSASPTTPTLMPRSKTLGLISSPQAAGGIGREVAYTFAEAGVKGALLADINSKGADEASEKSKALASNPDYQCVSTSVDVTDAASVDAMVKLAVERFGRIDYCINAFGVGCRHTKYNRCWMLISANGKCHRWMFLLTFRSIRPILTIMIGSLESTPKLSSS